jgi:acyl-coenzyme A thioesterase PaaI-like protein
MASTANATAAQPEGPPRHPPTEAFGRLLDATTRVLSATYAANGVDDAVIATLAGRVEAVADEIERAAGERTDPPARLSTEWSPMAPRVVPVFDGEGYGASVRFDVRHEGPPGLAHGGWIAYAFDELLGRANADGTFGGLTAELSVSYRRPTPIGAVAEARARIESQSDSGRARVVRGTMRVDGDVACEARAVFVRRVPPS